MTTTAPTEMAPANGAPAAPLATAEPERDGALNAFSDEAAFETGQRMAKALAASTLVPTEYRNNIPNVLIAIEVASRIRASVFMVMQSLDIVHGRPSWRASFLIATVNACGRFSPLRFRFHGKEGTDEWGCRAYAKDRENGEDCVGSLITIGLAKAEGWYGRNGSKWRTMPEQMLCYRSAAFWTRVYAPELSLGMQTVEEVIDTVGVDVTDRRLSPTFSPPSAAHVAANIEASIREQVLAETPRPPATAEPPTPVVKGEVSPTEPGKTAGKRAWGTEAAELKEAIVAASAGGKGGVLRKQVRDRVLAWTAEAPPELVEDLARFYAVALDEKAPTPRQPGEEG